MLVKGIQYLQDMRGYQESKAGRMRTAGKQNQSKQMNNVHKAGESVNTRLRLGNFLFSLEYSKQSAPEATLLRRLWWWFFWWCR
jgi:hypothetical protein